jgi:endonuclease/exonuclease/phosphatase (EEP) superfamily protein YafD
MPSPFTLALRAGAASCAALVVGRALVGDAWMPMIWVSAGLPWVLLPAWGLVAAAGLRRDVLAGAMAGSAALVHAAAVGPGLVGEASRFEGGTALRVATANVLYVQRHPAQQRAELLALGADLLVLQEVSHAWAAALDAREVAEAFPHRRIEAREGAFGFAVLSRHPLSTVEEVDLAGVPLVDATMSVDGRPVRVFGVHTLPPYRSRLADVWRRQLAILEARVRRVQGPLLVLGDFNASVHNPSLARVLGPRLRDAHGAVGRGLAPTWPNHARRPPLTLDHVLVSTHFAVGAVREGRGSGSDHRPVVADLRLDPRVTRERSRGSSGSARP